MECHISRLQKEYLLLALCIPFLGELCLLVAEVGNFQAGEVYTSPLLELRSRFKTKQREQKQSIPTVPGEEITREKLLLAVKCGPEYQIALMKAALRSSDAEVAHIAAANIMKIQCAHEQKIKECRQEYIRMPEDGHLLEAYIQAVDDYLKTELLEGESKEQLVDTKAHLMEQYERFYH
jgi:hypothetical protein